MADLRIAIAGCTGRMGLALLHELVMQPEDSSGGLVLSGATVRASHASIGALVSEIEPRIKDAPRISGDPAEIEEVFEASDVIIDFTSPATTVAHAKLARTTGTALLVGTTGLGVAETEALKAAALSAPILIAPNTSLGINLMLGFARDAAARLGPDFAISVDDLHHAGKKDAPSGTALALAQAIAPESPGDISITSRRDGEAAGTHTVTFKSALETLQLVHCAKDRSIFAKGALVAARWLAGQNPGHYTMTDVLGLAPGEATS